MWEIKVHTISIKKLCCLSKKIIRNEKEIQIKELWARTDYKNIRPD